MIRVRVHINEKEIIDLHAVRERHWAGKSGYHRFNLYITKEDNDTHGWIGEMRHKYSDGAAKLSAKMLYMYDKHSRRMIKESVGPHSKNQIRLGQT